MPSYVYARSLQGTGAKLGGRPVVRTGDHANEYEVSLPAATALTNWLKTDADTGTADMPAGFTNGTYDVYWSGGIRYGVAGTQIGTSSTIQLDGGTGDDFPASATAVTICEQVVINTKIDGDEVHIIGIELYYDDPDSTSLGHVDMQDSGAATIEEIDLTANKLQVWDIDGGDTNVFTGNLIETTYASHNDTANAAILRILSLEDSTP